MGHYITRWLGSGHTISRSVTLGFTALVAVFEIIAIPCIMTEQRFSVLLGIYCAIAGICLAVSIVHFIRSNGWKCYSFRLQIKKKSLLAILFVLIFMQMFLSSYLCHTDADDGYFVTISNIAVEKDQICLDGDIVYNGISVEKPSFRPEIAAWELFLAGLAKLFMIHPAVLAHTVMPFLLIALCYVAVYELMGRFIKDRDRLALFMIFYGLLNLFGGYSIYSSGSFLLLRIWQGKAMLVNYAFPVLLGSCVEIYRKEDTWRTWIWNVAVAVAGMAFTVVGLYLMPVYYIVVGIPYVVQKLFKRDWKRLGQVVGRAFLTMLPVIAFVLYIFVRFMTSEGGRSYSQAAVVEWQTVFEQTMGQGACFVLFLVALLYFYIKKPEKDMSFICCGMTVTLFATFLNPLFCSFVSSYVTGADVYWRLYWMLPIYYAISYVLTVFLDGIYGFRRYVSFLLVVMIVLQSGQYMYKDGLYFADHGNRYKIPDEVINVSGRLIEKGGSPVCLFSEDISYYVRQYTSEIAVVKARGMSTSEEQIKNTDKDLGWLYDQIYNQYNLGSEEVAELLDMLGVDYVYMRADLGAVEGREAVDGYGYLYPVASLK